jgi:hypothetical protein
VAIRMAAVDLAAAVDMKTATADMRTAADGTNL